MRFPAAIGLVLALVFGGAIVAAGSKVRVQSEPGFNFATFRSWNWNPSGPGEIKVWISADSRSEPAKRKYEPIIMHEIEDRLAQKKFMMSSAGAPDFLVTYYVLVTAGSTSQQMGQFLPPVTDWALPPFQPQTMSLTVYPQGTFILDISEAASGKVIWRGLTQTRIDYEKTDAQRQTIAREAVKDLLAKFPPKNKK